MDGSNRLLEQYLLVNGQYDFAVLFVEEDVVHSPKLTCISFHCHCYMKTEVVVF